MALAGDRGEGEGGQSAQHFGSPRVCITVSELSSPTLLHRLDRETSSSDCDGGKRFYKRSHALFCHLQGNVSVKFLPDHQARAPRADCLHVENHPLPNYHLGPPIILLTGQANAKRYRQMGSDPTTQWRRADCLASWTRPKQVTADLGVSWPVSHQWPNWELDDGV